MIKGICPTNFITVGTIYISYIMKKKLYYTNTWNFMTAMVELMFNNVYYIFIYIDTSIWRLSFFKKHYLVSAGSFYLFFF